MKKIIGMFAIFCILGAVSFASEVDERSSLLHSFISKKPSAVQPKSKTLLQGREYLPLTIPDEDSFHLLGKFMVTYCLLAIDEKQYPVSDDVYKQLETYANYPIQSLSSYYSMVGHSRRFNYFLPCAETRVVWPLRRIFTYFLPEIDMYADLSKIRVHYPLAAGCLDNYFKVEKPEMSLKEIYEALLDKRHKLSVGDYVALFSLYIFDVNESQNLEAAKNQAIILKSQYKLEWPHLFCEVLSQCLTHKEENENRDAREREAFMCLSGNEAVEMGAFGSSPDFFDLDRAGEHDLL